MTEIYVKPTATKTDIPKLIEDKDGEEMTVARKEAILKCFPITVLDVRKILRCSGRRAKQELAKLHEKGEIKTYNERYLELYPPPKEAEEI